MDNTIERLNREVRRRTRVVGTFPDVKSALMLVAARLKYVADSEWGPGAICTRPCSRSSHANGWLNLRKAIDGTPRRRMAARRKREKTARKRCGKSRVSRVETANTSRGGAHETACIVRTFGQETGKVSALALPSCPFASHITRLFPYGVPLALRFCLRRAFRTPLFPKKLWHAK